MRQEEKMIELFYSGIIEILNRYMGEDKLGYARGNSK